jgi:excisionase family DNA binding protein
MNFSLKKHDEITKFGGPETREVPTSETPGYMDTKAACSYLSISRRYLFSLRSTGKIKYYQVNKLVRFKKEDLDAYLEEHVMETFNNKGGGFKC